MTRLAQRSLHARTRLLESHMTLTGYEIETRARPSSPPPFARACAFTKYGRGRGSRDHRYCTVEPPITDSPFNGTLYKAGGTFGTDRQPTMSRTFSTP